MLTDSASVRRRMGASLAMTAVALWLLSTRIDGQAPAPHKPSAETLTAKALPVETLRVPTFGTVTIYRSAHRSATQPNQVVLFLSGDGGWNLGVVEMAEQLRREGALVVGIDIRAFMKNLDASSACAYPAGALEELSRFVQTRLRLSAYKRPMLVGYSSGATMAYAAIAAAPPETFAGAVSLGFCPELEIRAPLCQMRGLRATKKPKGIGSDLAPFGGASVPWMVLQGEVDQACVPGQTRVFVAATGAARLFSLPNVGHGFGVASRWQPPLLEAYHAIADHPSTHDVPRASTPEIADLSLIEAPAKGAPVGDTMAVLLSGDGGWADIDKALADGLSAAGIPVVGWSSLDYYWSPRSPAAAAADLARIVMHYSAAWKRPRVIVVGYSFGADVASFLVNRLPSAAKAHVSRVALLGPSEHAAFEFHVASWLGGGSDLQYPTRPELQRLDVPTLCVSATDEKDSVCRTTPNRVIRAESVGSGHHFGGKYRQLVDLMLK